MKMTNKYRTNNCGELTIKNVGQEVRLAGWIQKIRNLGGMTFVDLRDQYGITQVVISSEELKEQMAKLCTESVISVDGFVVERSNKNPKMSTGDIEIDAKKITLLGECESTLPFEVNSEKADISSVREDLRLEYTSKDMDAVKRAIDIYEDGRNITYNKEKMQKTVEDELGYKLPDNFMERWSENLKTCIPDKIDSSIIETLEYLSKKYNLAILSNWLRDSQIGRLKNANLYKYFSDFYITEDIPMKPNKESFEIAIGNYAKDECIMIGDSLKTDIKGAVNAGIKAIYLNKTSEEDINTENITTIHKLSELRKIL